MFSKEVTESKLFQWFNDRLEVQAISDDIASKYVPPPCQYFLLPGWNYLNLLLDPVRDCVCDDLLLQTHRC